MSFIVEGQAVEINFKINKNGFVIKDETEIETVKPEISTEEYICYKGFNAKEVSTFKFENKNTTEL